MVAKRRLLVGWVAGMAAALALAPSALAAKEGGHPGPPSYNHSDDYRAASADVFHCQRYNDGAGTLVFTPGRPGHPGRVNDNCRG